MLVGNTIIFDDPIGFCWVPTVWCGSGALAQLPVLAICS